MFQFNKYVPPDARQNVGAARALRHHPVQPRSLQHSAVDLHSYRSGCEITQWRHLQSLPHILSPARVEHPLCAGPGPGRELGRWQKTRQTRARPSGASLRGPCCHSASTATQNAPLDSPGLHQRPPPSVGDTRATRPGLGSLPRCPEHLGPRGVSVWPS